MNKSIKKFEGKELKNVKAVKGGNNDGKYKGTENDKSNSSWFQWAD